MFARIWKLLRDRQSTHSPPPVSPVDRASVGRRGEESAVRWLQAERKMRLITRNWRSARGGVGMPSWRTGVSWSLWRCGLAKGHTLRTIFATVNKKKKKAHPANSQSLFARFAGKPPHNSLRCGGRDHR